MVFGPNAVQSVLNDVTIDVCPNNTRATTFPSFAHEQITFLNTKLCDLSWVSPHGRRVCRLN